MPAFGQVLAAITLAASPVFLEEEFELPPGFRIYRSASAELTGGSYDIALDARGRLLAGDGERLRRLADRDGDGVFDDSEVIAEGLGPRGPQGLLVYGERLYAVGGDGIQLFEGYGDDGKPVHRGRLGERFNTGGDHDAHTILRGLDGWLYFITGDGGGARERRHITEARSPCLIERSCSVFRISPDGKRWECVGSGGRNAPNLGVNEIGELFSLDSDMEWHVALPWWRPVRLHHWATGGDQGWQDVGAFPPYYLDNLPGVFDVGRGSPDWGSFYEHEALPEKYRGAYLVCDYPSKSATTGGYETAGRLFAFFLNRDGSAWRATHEVLARPKPGAKDEKGRGINFALVDVEVAPDGSVLLSDHGQGIWRLIHDPERRGARQGPPIWTLPAAPVSAEPRARLDQLLSLPQPGAEWSRARAEAFFADAGAADALRGAVLDAALPLAKRLRALRYLAPSFESLPESFIEALARDGAAELRGQAAWLIGIRQRGGAATLIGLLEDADGFVRRRSAEALMRIDAPDANAALVRRLSDPERGVRYAAMAALAHRPAAGWFDAAAAEKDPQARMRALVAARMRREAPAEDEVRALVRRLLAERVHESGRENHLDLLRILGLHREAVSRDAALREQVLDFLLAGFPHPDRDVGFERARLLGEYRAGGGFAKLLSALESEPDPVRRFHLAQALARLESGWSPEEERRALDWILSSQRGWFAEYEGKGLQFREFWSTVLAEFASRHREAMLARAGEVELTGPLGGVVLDLIGSKSGAARELIALYRSREHPELRRRIIGALGRVDDPAAQAFLRDEYLRLEDGETRRGILRSLARGPVRPENAPILLEGLALDEREVQRQCGESLARYKLEPDESTARVLLSRLADAPELVHEVESALAAASERRRPGFDPARRPSRDERRSAQPRALEFWKAWYAERFGRAFAEDAAARPRELADEALRALLLSDASKGGETGRGRKLYESLKCASCHGGLGGKDERLFGPDLAGVTRRLKPEELADALVFPSKTVADRFKAKVILLKDGLPLTGFITEEGDDAVVLVDPEALHRVPRRDILAIAPQESSLMPERLLNRLAEAEVRDLMAFIAELGERPDASAGAPKD